MLLYKHGHFMLKICAQTPWDQSYRLKHASPLGLQWLVNIIDYVG